MPFHVYIMASRSRVLYIGVTNNLARRVHQHREGEGSAFTQAYCVDQLVYCEEYAEIRDAILREKQLKGWLRARKVELIESLNPDWRDLSSDL